MMIQSDKMIKRTHTVEIADYKLMILNGKITKKHKPTNVGRIALERQARQLNSGAVA